MIGDLRAAIGEKQVLHRDGRRARESTRLLEPLRSMARQERLEQPHARGIDLEGPLRIQTTTKEIAKQNSTRFRSANQVQTEVRIALGKFHGSRVHCFFGGRLVSPFLRHRAASATAAPPLAPNARISATVLANQGNSITRPMEPNRSLQ